jgi:hypothetical protein
MTLIYFPGSCDAEPIPATALAEPIGQPSSRGMLTTVWSIFTVSAVLTFTVVVGPILGRMQRTWS